MSDTTPYETPDMITTEDYLYMFVTPETMTEEDWNMCALSSI